MNDNIRRDLINRMFDKEMNSSFDAYNSANRALDEYHSMYPPNLSVNKSYQDILNEQITKDLGYQNATVNEALHDYHKWYGRGSSLDLSTVPSDANIGGGYDFKNDIVSVSPINKDVAKIPTLAHEIAHEVDWKHGPSNYIEKPHIPMSYYTDDGVFSDWLSKTGKIMPRRVEGLKLSKRDMDGRWSVDWAERLRKEDKKHFGSSFDDEFMLEKAGVTGSDVAEGFSYGHHLPDNKHIESSTGIILPKEAAIHPIEKRLILARMIKNMGLKSLPVISTIAESAGNVAGLAEAAQHPLTDSDEIGLRLVNTIAPNEQTEADIEYMKKLREYNSL